MNLIGKEEEKEQDFTKGIEKPCFLSSVSFPKAKCDGLEG